MTGTEIKPWENEPNREEFEHAGFPCLLNRNPYGAWCGYVAVPPGHLYHGLHYRHFNMDTLAVHGGLTYSGTRQGESCHPGEPEDAWWFGFDCAHYGDVVPLGLELNSTSPWRELAERIELALGIVKPINTALYRDINYVREETKRLAEQLRARA